MTRHDTSIITLALVPNGVFVLALMGWIGERVMAGLAPLPNGAMPFVMALCVGVPIATAALANVIRIRRKP